MTSDARPVALVEPSGHGGLSHFTFALASALAEAGERVALLTGRDYEMQGRPRAFEIVTVFDRLRTNPLSVWRALRGLRPRVVHLHGAAHPELYVPLLLALRALRLPTIYSVHDVEPRQHGWFPTGLLRLLFRLPDRIVAHSRHVADRLEREFGVSTDRIDVVPHGNYVYLSESTPGDRPGPDEVEPVVLFFGYILPQKGLDDLLAAFESVVHRVPAARLLIVGQPVGSFEPYRRHIEAAGLVDRVTCRLGYVPFDEMAHCFGASRVVALPYRTASQSGVLFNAFGAGRPVVATDCPGLAEFVDPDRTGLLVPVRDPAALADALVRLLEDPAACRRMGAEARRRSASELSWAGVATSTRRVYAAAVADGPPAREELWNHRSG